MKYSEAKAQIISSVKAGWPFILLGSPGIGKTELAKSVLEQLGYDVVIIQAALRDPVDFLGTPYPDTVAGVTRWLLPAWLPREKGKKVAILFDELTQATVQVQNALLRVLAERSLENWVAPAPVVFGATGNRAKDRAGANRLTTACGSRLKHLPLEVDADEWHAWAATAGVHATIRSFLRFRPTVLSDFDPARDINPNPRAWCRLSDELPHLTDGHIFNAAAGWVGDGPAAEFTAYTQVAAQLPDPEKVLADPSGADVPDELSAQWATVGAVTEALKAKFTPARAESHAAYVARFAAGQAACGFLDTMNALKKDTTQYSQYRKAKAYLNWATKNRDVIIAAAE